MAFVQNHWKSWLSETNGNLRYELVASLGYNKKQTMCKIVSLRQIKENPLLVPSQRTVKAAWHFIHAALWAGQQFSKAERKRSYQQIIKLLGSGDGVTTVTFYERILLERSRLQTETSAYLPAPSVWLNPDYPHGYITTAILHQDHLQGRPVIPLYHEQIRTLACAYFNFIKQPDRLYFSRCTSQLRELKGFSLLQIFYEAAACNYYL